MTEATTQRQRKLIRLQKPYVIKWLHLALHKPDVTYFPILFSGSVPVLVVEKGERRERDPELNGDLAQTIVSAVKNLAKAHNLLKFVNNLYKIMFLVEFIKNRSHPTWALSPIPPVSSAQISYRIAF